MGSVGDAALALAQAVASESATPGRHLMVFSHGFMGRPVHLTTVIGALQALPDADKRLIILNSEVNNFYRSLDGIDVCGTRLVLDIKRVLQENPDVTRISLVGYSQGGLLMRFAAGCLFADGIFERIEAMVRLFFDLTAAGYLKKRAVQNFVTIASPHLGVCRPPTTATNRASNYFLAQMGSHSGQHMLLTDAGEGGVPLLVRMTLPDSHFMRGLALFKQRFLYANVIADLTVPYCAASIQPHNYYRKPGYAFRQVPGFPSIVKLHRVDERPDGDGDGDGALDYSALLPQAKDNERAIDALLRALRTLAIVLLLALFSPIFLVFFLVFCLASVYSRLNVAFAQRHYKALPEALPPTLSTDALGDAKWRQLMLDNLNLLAWTRVDVYIPGAFNTHGLIITRDPRSPFYRGFSTRDVTVHLAKALAL